MEQMMSTRTDGGSINPNALRRAKEAFNDELKAMNVAQSEVEKPKRFIIVLVAVNTDEDRDPSVSPLSALEQFETTDPREAFATMQKFFERTLAGEGRWVSVETIPDGQESVVNYGDSLPATTS